MGGVRASGIKREEKRAGLGDLEEDLDRICVGYGREDLNLNLDLDLHADDPGRVRTRIRRTAPARLVAHRGGARCHKSVLPRLICLRRGQG